MSNIFETETKIKQIIDELKALSAQAGLANQGEEERIITSVFLYKFLNDKFMYNLSKFAEEIGETIEEILKNENDELDAFYDTTSGDVAFGYEDTIQYLINHVEQADFYKQFDDALVRIAQNTRNDIFAVETAEGSYRPLFEAISTPVEPSNRNNFAKNIFGIIAQDKFDFSSAFAGSFDFYSTIFEYLIKDYNVASGVYAEYFTPQSVSSIIARCLVGMSDKVEASEISDPAAGSGSLVLHLAHELGQENGLNRAIVYTQDISSKSTRFLRLNMMLKAMLVPDIFDGDVVSSHHITTIAPDVDELKYYIYSTCKTTWFHKYIVGFASGTNILGLDFKGFEDYLMPLPPMRLLQKFATTIKNIESEKSLIITENIELTSLRDFLLPMLMNGQVKVKGRDI